MSSVLVINSGSSSFKYQLIRTDDESVLASGLVERIGEEVGHAQHDSFGPGGRFRSEVNQPIPDHTRGFAMMLQAFAEHGPDLASSDMVAVGHRVVQGGARFFAPTLITDQVEWDINDLSALAPLHNPGAVQGIVAARAAFPALPHIAVFDTAFHQTMPPEAYTYAIDAAIAKLYRIRRYGFHGTSHKYVSEAAAAFLGKPVDQLNQIVLHIGNGASACAIREGKSVETSMGMTPLEGLVMGTRSGDIDPAALFNLHRRADFDFGQLDDLVNKRSGLAGLAGSSDMRDVQNRAASGDEAAAAAIAVYTHRIKHYVGAYYAQLGRVDTIVFTAGVGENAAPVRAQSLAGLEGLGIEIDPTLNESSERGARVISTPESRVTVLVVPTNEELEIARQAVEAIAAAE